MPERPAPKPKGGEGGRRTQLQVAKESSRHLAPTRAAQRWNPGNMHPERLMYPFALLCDCGHSVPVINVHTPRRNPEKKRKKKPILHLGSPLPSFPPPPLCRCRCMCPDCAMRAATSQPVAGLQHRPACLLLRLRLEDHLVVGEGREIKGGLFC